MTTQNVMQQMLQGVSNKQTSIGKKGQKNSRKNGSMESFDLLMNQKVFLGQKSDTSHTQSVKASKIDAMTSKASSVNDNVSPVLNNVSQNVVQLQQQEVINEEEIIVENSDSISDTASQVSLETVVSDDFVEVVQAIMKEILDVSQEDLEQIMSQLGLSYPAILDINSLQALVMNQAGVSEVTELLTNENLGNQLQELLTMAEQLQQMGITSDITISEEEMQQVMQQLGVTDDNNVLEYADVELQQGVVSESMAETQQKEFAVQKAENVMSTQNETTQVLENANENQTFSSQGNLENGLPVQEEVAKTTVLENQQLENVHVSGKNLKTESEVEEDAVLTEISSTEDVSLKDAVKISVEVETDTENKEAIKDTNQEKDMQTTTSQPEAVFDKFLQNLTGVHGQDAEQVQLQAERIEQMHKIVTQVVEQIKVLVKPDTTSMEIQLNPESLGKVSLSVMAKHGQITASFIAQNEATQKALESQVQVLRENLQEQGLKVDAIEVTISSNSEFEQSMQMGGQSQQGQQQKKAPRKLNLEELNGDVTSLSEEETLAVKVMEANGNQVDYTA